MKDPTIHNMPSKKLIGINSQTSLSEFNPSLIWQKFMPRLKEIENKVGNDKYSIQIYDQAFSYDSFMDHSHLPWKLSKGRCLVLRIPIKLIHVWSQRS